MNYEAQMNHIEERIESGEYADNGRSIGNAWRRYRECGKELGRTRVRRRFNYLAKKAGYAFQAPIE